MKKLQIKTSVDNPDKHAMEGAVCPLPAKGALGTAIITVLI